MRILKQGNVSITLTSTCWKCKCIFEYGKDEAQKVSDQRDGDYWQINCPCCDGIVTQQCEQGYNGPG